MFKFLRRLSKLLVIASTICFVAHADKTMNDYSKEADVFFDVQKSTTGLELIGREGGKDVFRTAIQNFSNFSEFSQGGFQIQRLQDSLYWRYSPTSSDEFFEVVVKQNGDIQLSDLPQNYTGFDHYKTYAFRTSGTLENRGSQAFYKLVLSANQFHNFGTIQTCGYHFFQDYRFNSGVIKSGEIPKGVANLHNEVSTMANPSFKRYVIENYGKEISKGTVEIKDSLSYHNHNETVMEDLGMFGGDVKVLDGNMNIAGVLKGTIKDLEITNNSALYVKTFEVTQKGTFNQSNGGMLYTSDDEKIRLNGLINEAVDERISKLSEETKRRYQRSYPSDWKTPAALEAGTGLPGGGAAGSIVGGLVVGGIASAVGGHHHGGGGGGIHVGVNQNGQVFTGPSHASLQHQSRQRRNHEIHFEGQMQESTNGGYLRDAAPELFRSPLARNTSILKEAMKRSKAYIPVNQYDGSKHKNRTKPELQIVNAFNLKIDVSEYQRNRDYFSRLKNSLLMAKIPQNDISTIWGDVWLRTVSNWDRVPQQKKLDLIHEDYQIYDMAQKVKEEREEFRNILENSLNNPINRFIDDLVIPMTVFATQQTPYGRAATAMVATAEVVVPKLAQVATAIGATTAYQKYSTFLSKKAGGSEPSKAGGSDRIQATRTDADKYLQGLKDKGVLSNKRLTKDRREYYEFTEKCEYQGSRFKKGEFIERDTQHHEWEYFKDKDTHKGAIDSITGKLNEAKARADRTLKI